MKIAFVSPETPRGRERSDSTQASWDQSCDLNAPHSGGYFYNARIARELRSLGHEVVSIYTTRTDERDPRELVRLLSRFDTIVEDELGFACYAQANALLGARVPIVALVHVPTILLGGDDASAEGERAFLRTVDAAIFVSRTTLADARPLLDDRIATFVARPGCDFVAPGPRPSFDAPIRFVGVGHILPHKGWLELVSVLEQVSSEGGGLWHLDVIGDESIAPDYAREVRERVRTSCVFENVTIHGRKTREEVRAILRDAHAFLSPSFYESYGLAASEAIASGLPVIGWTFGGLRELVRDGFNGLLVEPSDTQAFAVAISLLDRDRALLEKLSRGAEVVRSSLPSWRETAEIFERVVTGLRTKGRSPHREALAR